MSDKKRTEQLLKRFEESEKDAIEGVMRRIGKTEAKIAQAVGKIPRSLSKELDSLRGRFEDARRSADDRVEEFRGRLIDGPLSEEELRARLVMLEMEYASRVQLAEQGFDLLAERLEDYVASGRNWLSDVCDQVRLAVRVDVKPVRARLGEALVQRADALAALERELGGLREHRETSAPLEKKMTELERKNSSLEEFLERSRAAVNSLTEANEVLEKRVVDLARQLGGSTSDSVELSDRLGRAEEESSQLLEQMRAKQKEGEASQDELIAELRNTISPLLDERLGLRSRIKALEARVAELKSGDISEVAEKEEAAIELLKELSGFREAAGRLKTRIQVLESELAQAKAELKEMRQERRGLVERFNAATQARDVERMRADKAEAKSLALREGGTDPVVSEMEMKLAAAARGLVAVRDKVKAARARILELEAKAETDKDKTLDIDAEKADLAQRVAGKDREIAKFRRVLFEKSSALASTQESLASMREQLDDAQKKRAGASDAGDKGEASADVESLREQVAQALAAKREVADQLATERKSAKMMQKRLFGADVARDRALSETRAQWADEQEAYEEKMSELTRERGMFKTQLATANRSWQETLARQDAGRMREIFKLRAEVQKLKWALEEKEK
ncbi:MAG: hypothetical protein COB53_10230 [Elusimicrobia bacterium]|nr:MAG: hypothetical protein COB53_10230 [Elusimicrobiota bacterium]